MPVTNFKKLHGPPLVKARYMIVPIKTGAKYPNKKGWPKIRSTLADVESWSRSGNYGGLGVLGEFNPGIDIDVCDASIVDKLLAWCKEHIGVTPVRTGNAPRVLIPCAAPYGGLGPDNSAKYEDQLGNTHQIEIKAKGQQWVAYGVHPQTNKPYTWSGGELHDVDSEFLPTLTGSKIRALFDYFESIAPLHWDKISKGAERTPVGHLSFDTELSGVTTFENYTPPINVDPDQIRSMLAFLSPDQGHRDWVTVGMALHHQFAGDREGLELFREWSENSRDYDYNEILTRWPTWGASTYGGAPITMATVVKMYNDAREESKDPTLEKKSKKLSDWEERFVMVDLAESSEVHDAGVPIYKARRHTLRAFKEQNSGYIYRYETKAGEEKSMPMVDAWQSSRKVKHFAGYTYQPGNPRFCNRPGSYGDDTLYINKFYFPPHTQIENPKEKIKPFMALLRHLFPVNAEREFFKQWLARLIQNPAVRSFVTPINITPVTGTGRGILFDILRLLVGAHNTHDVSPDDMEGRFNGFLDKCLIAVVQEIKASTGTHKFQTWERMKSLLADTVANIQAKGQDSYTANVYANFLMFSNNIDALPLKDVNERRIYAMQGACRPLSNEEIDIIMAWKQEPTNISALFNYLKKKKVNNSLFKRAPKSVTKVQMVDACVGLGGAELEVWLREEAPEVFDFGFAATELEKFSEDIAVLGLSRDRFSRTLLDLGYHGHQISVNGWRVRAYYHPARTQGDKDTLKRLLNKKEEDILA